MKTLVAAVLLTLAASCTNAPAPAETTAPPALSKPRAAADIIADGVKAASQTNRTVLIEFGASWCTWCRNFETFVKAPETAPIIAKHFVVLNLVVREEDEKKALENAGGFELLERWGGAKSGIPFYVFLDARGEMIATSNAMPNGDNIGFPAVPQEISAFISVIGKAAPSMSADERRVLETYLTNVMPKPTT